MSEKKSQLKAGIILSYVNMGLGNLIPIFYTPVMLSILGQSEYGLYKLSSSVTSYLSLISMGIGSAVTRYLIKAYTEEGQESEEKVLGLFMVIFQIIAVISFVVGVVLTFNLQIWYGDALTPEELYRMKILVFLMVCNTALSFSIAPYMSVVTAHEKFLFYQYMNIVSTCVAPFINLIMLFLGYASIGIAVSSLVLNILIRIIYLIYIQKYMGIHARYKGMPTHLLKEILSFSFWIFLSNVASQLYKATDTVMIGAVPALAATGVAVYSIGCMFTNIVSNITTGVSSLLAPRANKMVFSNCTDIELIQESIKIGRIQGYITGLITSGFVAFGKPFIFFYAGKNYLDAYWVAVAVMIPTVIPTVQSYCLSILIAKNKHRFRSFVYLFIAIINVVGTWFAMQEFGVIGAAIMTGWAIIIGNGFMMNWYYHKRSNLNMYKFWTGVAETFIIPVIMTICTLIVGNRLLDFYRPIVFIFGVIVYVAIWAIASWLLIMNKYEKELIISVLHLKLKKRWNL